MVSYTIWFTQRSGSSWLCEALDATGVAGHPAEHLNFAGTAEALALYGAPDGNALLAKVREAGRTANGVFGIKQGYHEPGFTRMTELLAGEAPEPGVARLAVWERFFPDHRHVFLTRRNKVRLAVSWWRAIQSGEWHRRVGTAPAASDLADGYDAAAIDRLLQESVMREAGLQELFAEAGVVPLTLTYEDFASDLGGAVSAVLDHIGRPGERVVLPEAGLERIADDLSESWVQRFRREKQAGWSNRGW